MTIKKIKTSDILGDNYYIYELTSSNYTPALNGTITITCICKEVYGNTVMGKTLTLYQNGTSKGAKTTDSNGVVTWSITCSSAGLQKFNIKDASIEVFVDNKAVSSHQHGNITSDGKITTSHNGTYSTFIGVQDSTGTLYKASKINSDIIIDGTAHANIGSNANDNQSVINTAINTALGNKANSTHSHSLSSLGGTVTVEKLATAESGYLSSYVVKQNDVQVGNTINIPKDFLVKSATLNTCSTANNPVSGYTIGDKYLDFVVNAKDNSATNEHLYVLVSDLVNDMTVDEELSSSSENPVQNMVIYDAIDTLNGDLSNDILYTRLDLLGCNTFTIKDFTNPNNWTTPNNCTYSDGTLTFTGSNSFSANFPTQSFAGYNTGFELNFDYVVDNGLVLNERIVWECLNRQFSYVITEEDVNNGKIAFDISFIADENRGIIESEELGEQFGIDNISVQNPYTINAITPLGTSTKITNIKYKANNIYSLNDNVNELQQNISDKEDKSNKVTSLSSSSTDTQYPSAKLVYNQLSEKATKTELNKKLDADSRIVTTFTPQDYQYTMSNGSWTNGYQVSLSASGQLALDLSDMFTLQDDYVEFIVKTGANSVSFGILYGNSNEVVASFPSSSTRRIKVISGNSLEYTISDESNNILDQFSVPYPVITFSSSSATTLNFGEKQWYHYVPFIDRVYPIGSIYMSMNSVNPSLFIGGEWERIQDTFLLASGSTYGTGTTGGSADAVVVSHSHSPTTSNNKFLVSQDNVAVNGTKRALPSTGTSAYYVYVADTPSGINENATTTTVGVSGTGKNMPPYLAVYVWKRIA